MKKIGFKIALSILFLFFLQIFLSYELYRYVNYVESTQYLKNILSRVKSDIKYLGNGKWDTNQYDADPQTPHPSGSSGFKDSLYIFTTDGFVFERNQPIRGYFDSSDYKKLLTYQTPQTIHNISDKSWRVYSLPIKDGETNIGVIFVSYYNPENEALNEIDRILIDSAIKINNQLRITNRQIDTKRVDIRNINYSVSFEVVDRYNIVLLNNGRTPSFIDPSYIFHADMVLKNKTIFDAKTKEPYFVVGDYLYNEKHETVALVVAGKSIKIDEQTSQKYLWFIIGTNFVFILPLYLLTLLSFRKQVIDHMSKKAAINIHPKKITFDKKQSLLSIDDEKIPLPYASHQYYFCEALITHPKRRFEQDELLERFGEQISKEGWRKVYDAMLALNKKTQRKIFVYKDKTYFINPQIIEAIK